MMSGCNHIGREEIERRTKAAKEADLTNELTRGETNNDNRAEFYRKVRCKKDELELDKLMGEDIDGRVYLSDYEF